MLGDDYHSVSIYAVPEMVARQHLFPYNSFFSMGNRTIQVMKGETRSIGARIFVYLLSSVYLNPGQEAVANINVEVATDFHSEPLPAPSFRFNSREAFSNFLDSEPGSKGLAVGCSCMLGNICSEGDDACVEKIREKSGCPLADACSKNTAHVSEKSSYNFITTMVPENSTVSYSADLLMYFYNTQAFEEYYMCTIREKDTCSFETSGVSKFSRSWDKRHIIVAYTHPTTVPSSLTTYLVIEAEKNVDPTIMICAVLVLVLYLIFRHCFHCQFKRYFRKQD